MVSHVLLPELDSLVSLVLCKTLWTDRHVYLGAQHPAAAAHGPADELRMEIHAADGPPQSRQCRGLALPADWDVTMARLCRSGCRSLHPARPWISAVEEVGKASLSIR